MNHILLVFLAIFSFQISNCQYQLLRDKKHVDSICREFMQTFSENKYTQAISMLKKYSVIDPIKIDDLIYTVEKQMSRLGNSFGKVLNYELMSEKNVKNFLLKKVYILKFEKMCLKFDFRFYDNGQGWTIINFNYSEDISEFLN
jgi:hypothetical protein